MFGANQKNNSHLIRKDILISVLITLTTFLVYANVVSFEFINYDDPRYIFENPHVFTGLSFENIKWAFWNGVDYWIPLTWISHIIDCSLFGLNPGLHHLENLIIHIINSLLLFFVLKKISGSYYRSGFVAALFALHPIHVESVAWISERKDLLSTFFMLMTIWCYSDFVRKRTVKNYLVVLLFFAFALMSKPMVVTLPITLVLLDCWPLKVFSIKREPHHEGRGWFTSFVKYLFSKHTLEKLPLIALSGAVCVITVISTKSISDLSANYPLFLRSSNGVVSYFTYIRKMFWPSDLAVFYPYPEGVPLLALSVAIFLFLAMTIGSLILCEKKPYIAVGWFWYVITMFPVLGIINGGEQALADRYTYIPSIGLFIAFTWGVSDLFRKTMISSRLIFISGASILVILAIFSFVQVQYWTNSRTLFLHALEVTSDNHVAHLGAGRDFKEQGQFDKAEFHYREALKIKPDWNIALFNLANMLSDNKRFKESIHYYKETEAVAPNVPLVPYNIALTYYEMGDRESARKYFLKTVQIDQNHADALFAIGAISRKEGKLPEAIHYFEKTLSVNPYYFKAHNEIGEILIEEGKNSKGVYHFKEALQINAEYDEAKKNLMKISRENRVK